jgi:hypothetical protein
MKKGIKFLLLCFTTVVVSFCLTIAVYAYNYANEGLKTVPTNIYFTDKLMAKENYYNRCMSAMETWNNTCFSYDCFDYKGMTIAPFYELDEDNNMVTDGKNTITSVLGYSQYQGVTNVYTESTGILWWKKTYIVEYDINLNSNVFWFVGENAHDLINGTEYRYDLESVVLHELGHALGLDHSDTEYTATGQRIVMYAYTSTRTVFRQLSEDDRLAVVNLY